MKIHNFIAFCLLPVLLLTNGSSGAAQKQTTAKAISAQELEKDYQQSWQFIADRYYDENALHDWLTWQHKYDGKLHTQADLVQALKEMTASINDPWTEYFSHDDLVSRHNPPKGQVSAGFWILLDAAGAPYVELCEEGLPAYDSPIRAGDTIVSINGVAAAGMKAQQVQSLLGGTVGQSLSIVYRDGNRTASTTVVLHEETEIKAQARILPGDILYVKLPAFNREDVDAFETAIDSALKTAATPPKGIIFDLRGNPGGFVRAAQYVASMFVEKGTLFTYQSRNGATITRETTIATNAPFLDADEPIALRNREKLLHELPVVILINHTTRSGAETVTVALKDNHRAQVIGEVSYGKSIAYDDFPQDFGGSLQVTIANISSPDGYSWQGKGLTPDQVVVRPRTGGADVQLDAALKALHP